MEIKSKFAFTTKKPVAILMIVIGIAVFGLVSLKRLSWELMPDISYPTFTVRTEYSGAAPEEVENTVSRPLEEQLSLIKNLLSITSVSRPEQSDIILEFNWDVNLDRASQEIREKIDQTYLDRAVERPMILRYDPSLDPVIRIGISAKDIPLIDLREIVEDEIARELESIKGVAAAKVKGGFEKEILIKLDEKKLAITKIKFGDITRRLNEENINLAGGNIKEGETEYIVRTLNEFRSIDEIGKIIIARKEQVAIRLIDIAEVQYSHKERQVITRVNNVESIEINIYKEADSNIVDVSNRVKERLFGTLEQQRFVEYLKANKEKIKTKKKMNFQEKRREKQKTNFLAYRLPKTLQFNILADQAIFIENSINEVKNTAIFGGVLAVIILFLFLQHFSTTVIVAISIPLSLIAAFAPLNIFQVSLNIMSLGGLALGIGMLVDNSIVVMESIFRCREEGDDWVNSAIRGVSEVGGAVVASTITTIAVFFPIVFVEGIAGQIFGDLSLAVVFSLLASLLVSLFFIPMLASRKFSFKDKKPALNFSFSFSDKKSIKTYLMIPVEVLLNFTLLVFNLIIVFTSIFISLIFILIYPLLGIIDFIFKSTLTRKGKTFSEFIYNKFSNKKTLWENFFKLLPFDQFIASMNKKRKWYLYYVFRFFLTALSFIFTRTFMTFFAIGYIFTKGFGIIILSIFVPIIMLAVKLFNVFLKAINKAYPKLLSFSLKNDLKIIIIVLIGFLITMLVILPSIGKELIPEVHQGTIYVNLTFPVGTPVEKTDRLVQNMVEEISKLELVKDISFYAGTTKDDLSAKEIGEHLGKITININKMGDIQKNEAEAISNIRSVLKNFTDLDYNISRPVLFTMKPPIEVIIKGYNLKTLRKVSSDLFDKISKIDGLKDIQTTIKAGFPELVIEFDRTRLAHYGMNAFSVASLVKNKIEGFVATKYKEKDRRVDVRVFLKDNQRKKAQNLKDLIINPGGEIPIRLSSIANINILSGPNEIRRVNQDRSAIISANIENIDLNEAVSNIYNIIEDYPMPPNFTYDLSGQNKEMKKSTDSLVMAMLLAIFLVYIVMASQFESFLHPFLILFTIPMAFIGVFVTLYVLKIPMGVTVFIGMITLVGIVVNNAIVLIDYINLLRKRGVDKLEAIKKAGSIRLRPILITTLTTVLGLLPMALGLGEGAEIRMPMAVSIIAGLLSATLLTLVLIPIVYNRFSK